MTSVSDFLMVRFSCILQIKLGCAIFSIPSLTRLNFLIYSLEHVLMRNTGLYSLIMIIYFYLEILLISKFIAVFPLSLFSGTMFRIHQWNYLALNWYFGKIFNHRFNFYMRKLFIFFSSWVKFYKFNLLLLYIFEFKINDFAFIL